MLTWDTNLTIKADCPGRADLREKCSTKPILLKTLERPENRLAVPNKAKFQLVGASERSNRSYMSGYLILTPLFSSKNPKEPLKLSGRVCARCAVKITPVLTLVTPCCTFFNPRIAAEFHLASLRGEGLDDTSRVFRKIERS